MCKYCNSKEDKNIINKVEFGEETFLYIHGNNIVIETYTDVGGRYVDEIINYCPMCGREL